VASPSVREVRALAGLGVMGALFLICGALAILCHAGCANRCCVLATSSAVPGIPHHSQPEVYLAAPGLTGLGRRVPLRRTTRQSVPGRRGWVLRWHGQHSL